MIGPGDWIVKMLASRLRSLGASQIKDLIKLSDEPETLETLKAHLESENFKYWGHLIRVKDDLIRMVDIKLNQIEWAEIEKKIEIVEEVLK